MFRRYLFMVGLMDIKQQQTTWQPTIFDIFPELDPDGIGLDPYVETIEPESVPNWNGWQDNDDEDDPSVQAVIGNQQADDGFFTAQDEYDETIAAIESQLRPWHASSVDGGRHV